MQAAGQPPFNQRVLIQSSELRWVEYKPRRSTLTAEFLTGGVYEYRRVPSSKFIELLAAESKGRYFNANIRGHHDFVRIS